MRETRAIIVLLKLLFSHLYPVLKYMGLIAFFAYKSFSLAEQFCVEMYFSTTSQPCPTEP
ncbi:MAG: hypothetical protein KJ714_04630 [Euryarchaeota archaeon]|nr:hypothetical protein [Euryarchaeota archaeon]